MSIINFPLGSASKQAKAGLNRRKMDPTTMNDDQRAEWKARKEKIRVAARKNYWKNHPEPVQSPPIVPPGKNTRVKAVEAGPSISSKRQVFVKREDQEYLVLVEDPTPTRYIDEADSDKDLGYGSGAPAATTRNGSPARTRCGTLFSNTDNNDPSTLRQLHRVTELEVEVRLLKEELAKLQEVADVVAISVENGLALIPGAKSGNDRDLEMELGEGNDVLGKQEDHDGMFVDTGVQTTPQDQLEGNTEIERVQIQGQCAETTVPCTSCEEAQAKIRKLNSELVRERRNLTESEKWATSCNEDLNDFFLSASPQTQSRLDFLGRLAMHCSGLRVYGGRIKTEHGADTRGLLRVIARIQEDLDEEVMKEDEGERKMRNLSSVRLNSKNAAPLAKPQMLSNASKNGNGKRTRGDNYSHHVGPCDSGGSHNTSYRRG
ncbi:hypothetical protein GALMADRAFT_232165 [Galerina marginata CBS 339.88]|uniref:Uncharacterized protein n=1 Tax=Galerina marginata (strain CBS 339.88) TaxID=685588 RepID=A0A067S8F5_GALM3|nr:hypothetical protein GALMADRAFT_232165 [Galerina marginata CBS 339.88]